MCGPVDFLEPVGSKMGLWKAHRGNGEGAHIPKTIDPSAKVPTEKLNLREAKPCAVHAGERAPPKPVSSPTKIFRSRSKLKHSQLVSGRWQHAWQAAPLR